jgi:polysaccharide export outer membrane protein
MALTPTTRTQHAPSAFVNRAARTLALVGLALLCAHPLFAQSTTYEIAASDPAPSPLSAAPIGPAVSDQTHAFITSFEPGANEEYTLDDGDEIHLDVSARPELSTNYILGPDGRITIPSIGNVQLSGLTRDQAGHAIETAMQPFYLNPAVTVGVVHYLSNHVLLLGAVKNPGVQNFDQPPTLMEVLARGGVGEGNQEGIGPGITASPGMPDHAFIYRGSQELAVVDLKSLLAGNSFADLRLRRNDIILIPVENQLVSILGSVKSPGAIRFTSDTTLPTLLSQAGGLSEQAGSNPLIQIVNTTSGTSTQVRFNHLLDPHHGNDISLHPGDVIFVPSSGFAKFAYVVDKLNPITTVIAFSAIAAK